MRCFDSAGYVKPPVNPIKWSELPMVWREQAIRLQDLSSWGSEILDNESCGGDRVGVGGQPDVNVGRQSRFSAQESGARLSVSVEGRESCICGFLRGEKAHRFCH